MSQGAVRPLPGRSLAIREDWLRLHHEDPLDPGQPIIDPHHHLWERPGERYLAPELLADIAESGHDVRATVHVQARSMYRSNGPVALRPVGETEFAAATHDASGSPRLCAAIVAHADLTLGKDVAAVLAAHREAGRGLLRGIRHITAWDGDAEMVRSGNPAPPWLMADHRFRTGFACLASAGLSFDAWLYHSQLDELVALARAFPEVPIVCDHAGGPIGMGGYRGQRGTTLESWRSGIQTLARCDNVAIKFGGLGMRVGGFDFDATDRPPSSDDLVRAFEPYFDTCVEAFGAERCMFESNFPVDKGSYSYAVFWNACKLLARGASRDEKAALFHGTATRFYRLDPALAGSSQRRDALTPR